LSPGFLSQGSFLIHGTGTVSNSSPFFTSSAGDTIVLFLSLLPKNTVTSVTDSLGDSFGQLVYSQEVDGSGKVGQAVYWANNVVGGPVTITATVHAASKGQTVNAAVEFVDVSGVAAAPLDSLSPVAQTSQFSSTQVNNFSGRVYANPGDIVLSGWAGAHQCTVKVEGSDLLLGSQKSSFLKTNLTVADFGFTPSASGYTWINGTTKTSTAWSMESFSLKPKTPWVPPATYSVTFNETGVPNGTLWSVNLSGSRQASVAPLNVTFLEPNGTYDFALGIVRGYIGTPAFGGLQIVGANVSTGIVYSPFMAPPGANRIQHVVVVFMENHAYDNYFGTYCLVLGPDCNSTANGIPPGTCVPYSPTNPGLGCVRPYNYTLHQLSLPDIGHTYDPTIASINGGAMNGFYAAEGNSIETFGHYNGTTIPMYWDLAEQYGLGDNFFSSALSYSLPNHWYLLAGQAPPQNFKTVFATDTTSQLHTYLNEANATESVQDLLNATNGRVSWKYYDWPLSNYTNAIQPTPHDGPGNGSAYSLWNPLAGRAESYTSWYNSHFVQRTQFFSDVDNGALPNISWVIPQGNFSDHPPANVTKGEAFVGEVVDSVEASPFWNSTAIIVSWDDYGGFYDHVAPPSIDPLGLSIRVPIIVISPYTPQGLIVHTSGDFDSILSLMEQRWGLGCITIRDCNAPSMWDYFNFSMSARAPFLFLLNDTYPISGASPDSLPFMDVAEWVGSDAGLTDTEAD
jgi:phospholipase C